MPVLQYLLFLTQDHGSHLFDLIYVINLKYAYHPQLFLSLALETQSLE